jgi:thioredoxin reductase (NADPH)
MIYDCIVIGAGPAGIAASIQLKRADLDVLVFEKSDIGGLLLNAQKIENYLGYVSISGNDLVKRFEEQLRTFRIPLIQKEVISLQKKKNIFTITVGKTHYQSRNVVIATGTVPKKIGIPGEQELFHSKKIFYAIRDLPKLRSPKTIVIIGGGDVGFDYALNIEEQGHRPIIITKNSVRCLPLLHKRVRNKKIPIITNCRPLCIEQDGTQVTIFCEKKNYSADYVLVAAGRTPQFPTGATNKMGGLYFVGDVHDKHYRQVHIATGDALRTAMNIIQSLL